MAHINAGVQHCKVNEHLCKIQKGLISFLGNKCNTVYIFVGVIVYTTEDIQTQGINELMYHIY